MLVRIKGIVEDILMQEGTSKAGKPWQKKVYVIRDNSYDKEEYNTIVHVNDFGKLDPQLTTPVFSFKSDHIKGETVDLACYLETNDHGFTNVNYGKPYEDIQSAPVTTNVIRPDETPATEPVPMQTEDNSGLPF